MVSTIVPAVVASPAFALVRPLSSLSEHVAFVIRCCRCMGVSELRTSSHIPGAGPRSGFAYLHARTAGADTLCRPVCSFELVSFSIRCLVFSFAFGRSDVRLPDCSVCGSMQSHGECACFSVPKTFRLQWM